MSSDIATLAQALGTVAKFARVMNKAGLSDEFYQKAIDESDFREAIVWLSNRPVRVEHNLQERAKDLLSKVEYRLSILGVKVNEATLVKTYNLSPETFHYTINYFEYNESRKIRNGPLSLHWRLTIKDSGDGLEAEVSVSLHLYDREKGYETWWSIDFDPDCECELVTDSLSLVGMVRKDNEPFTMADLSVEERWFKGHCRFMDPLHRLGEQPEGTESKFSRDQGLDLITVMVDTFDTTKAYFDREHAEDEIACPRCGGATIFSWEEMLQAESRPVYACNAGCTMDVQRAVVGWIKEPLRFYFGRAGWPRMAPMLR